MRPVIKDAGVIFLVGLLLLWGGIASIERLVFFNTNIYPDLFVNNTVSIESEDKMHELIESTCPQGGADIIKRNNTLYYRCGMFWPKSQVTKVTLVNKSNAVKGNHES